MRPKPGLILFAHGARDPRWAEPFERIRDRVATLRPDVPVRLAFLEIMEPNLASAAAELAAMQCNLIRVAPIFFGQGGHVRTDLPALISRVAADFPDVTFDCLSAAGEDAAVCDAVAAFCIDGIP